MDSAPSRATTIKSTDVLTAVVGAGTLLTAYLLVFIVFAALVLKERLTWNYAVSFLFILLAVYFAVAFKPAP